MPSTDRALLSTLRRSLLPLLGAARAATGAEDAKAAQAAHGWFDGPDPAAMAGTPWAGARMTGAGT
ncbi:hypothetical protein ABZ027_26540 [Streptomyces sp. NPDC006332]|uniref:hypothetical protein n=1 Tax=Streptomyces sp. NPDC006332 TaxID=3155456 RepID=UPI0033BA9F27